MKINYVTILLLFPFFVFAQKGTQTYSVSYGFGDGKIRPIIAMAKMSGSYTAGNVKTFGINLNHGIGKHTTFETGFIALKHNYTYTEYHFPPEPVVADKTNTSIIIPLKLKIDILKYLFISGGMLADISLNGEGTNLGFGIGAGVQYYYRNKYGFFIYPQANVHTVEVGLAESHIAFGLAYRIKKHK